MIGEVPCTVERTPLLAPDPERVLARLFVPGQSGFVAEESRSSAVLRRIAALSDDEVDRSLADVFERTGARHRDLRGTFLDHFGEVADRVAAGTVSSDARQLLVGAAFTCEYALEGAALCNPSIVAHPEQDGADGLKFVMSVRAIGEGHISSIGFRTGVVDATGAVALDEPPHFASCGVEEPALLDLTVFRRELDRVGASSESAEFVLDPLGQWFTGGQLEVQLARLERHRTTRSGARETITLLRAIAERSYGVRFSEAIPLGERVLWPVIDAERNGMEDARFVRFEDDGAPATYFATYTAYDGATISQQLLATTDFTSFTSSPLVGPAAANKGLALFPRRIGGRYAALSRADRETNAIAFSDNPRAWGTATPIQLPTRPWELLQLGNCGSPIETPAGWLVLTHGVGPMRTYSIGAILLDLDDPTRVIGHLREPLLAPAADERDGYVPNVVYSCGALVHGGVLVVPFGICDGAIGVATVPLDEMLATMGA
ncbi:MAG TPA: glycoside hydrolase family 130 protein [Acidimicrobiales bacterium]|nr:glycoside hydrolase family 130 protein [Acidimicrobiales bacterium]